MGRSFGLVARRALTPALLLACSPTLEVPLDADIVCASDADCPDGRVCQAVVGRCIDPTIVDEEAPVLLAAGALDSTVVMLDFSERLDPGTVGRGGFVIEPALEVSEAVVQPNLRQVTLQTAPQEPGLEYMLGVSAIADIAGNLIAAGSSQSFSGFGPAPDREPPVILAPQRGQVATSPSVTLLWTRRALARGYIVEVAYDPEFNALVSGFPITVDDPESSLIHDFVEPVRYYWRVRANTTRAGEYGRGIFDRLGTDLYVHCAAGATCSDIDPEGNPLPGNSAAPLRTLAGAVTRSRALGSTTIRIAARGGGEAYHEHVTIGDVNLVGGYDASFSERDPLAHPTIVSSDDLPAVTLLGSAVSFIDHVIEGLTLRSANGVALRIVAGFRFDIRHNDIAGGAAGIEVSNNGDIDIYENFIHSYPNTNGDGITLTSSSAVVDDNTIAIGGCTTAPCDRPHGISAEGGLLFARGNDITMANTPGQLMLGMVLREVFAHIERNRVELADGWGTALEVGATSSNASHVSNNILIAGVPPNGATAKAIDVRVSGGIQIAVANNLLFAGGGDTGTSYAAYDWSEGSSYVNNIMFTGPGTAPRYCLYEQIGAISSAIDDFRNNLLFDCPTALYYDAASPANRTNIADVNDVGTTTQGVAGTVAGNITVADVATVAFAAFPSSFALTPASPASVRLGGFNASLNACGPSGFFGCGAVVNDHDGAPRTCPPPGTACYSIGPYEIDP